MEKNNLLVVLTGKTAAGKDTIKDLLLERFPKLKKITTTTSRTPRKREVEGLDYYFISRKEFEEKIRGNEFIEWVEYGGNLYGTTKAELKHDLNGDLLWKMEGSRAGEIREFIKRALSPNLADDLIKQIVVIYLNTPDETILERLKERSLSDEEIKKRFADDKRIWDQFKDKYDYVLENVPGKLNETMEKIITILATKSKILRA